MTLVERLRQAPPQRQAVVAGLALVVVCAVLFAIYFLVLRKDYAVLFRDLRAGDAATIVEELDKKKVPYRLRDGGATVLVPEDVVDATRLGVMSQDLPLKGAVGFELFNKSDMGLTEFAQRINYQRALQGELARTIMTMDAVDSARVHLSMTEQTIFRGDRKPPKASVTLVPRAGRQLSADTVRGVQRLVAASIPDLDISNVVILDGQGQVVSGSDLPPTSLAPADVSQKQAIELYYAAKVRQAIAHLYPQGEANVTVSADESLTPPTPAGTTAADATEVFAGWTPQTRQFRLRVAVAAPPPLDPVRQEELRALASEAIGQGAVAGDVVTIFGADQASDAAAAPTRAVEPAAAGPNPAVEPTAAGASPQGFWVSALLGALLLLGALAFVLHRRRREDGLLSDDDREAYALRLKALLNEEEAHAAPRG